MTHTEMTPMNLVVLIHFEDFFYVQLHSYFLLKRNKGRKYTKINPVDFNFEDL